MARHLRAPLGGGRRGATIWPDADSRGHRHPVCGARPRPAGPCRLGDRGRRRGRRRGRAGRRGARSRRPRGGIARRGLPRRHGAVRRGARALGRVRLGRGGPGRAGRRARGHRPARGGQPCRRRRGRARQRLGRRRDQRAARPAPGRARRLAPAGPAGRRAGARGRGGVAHRAAGGRRAPARAAELRARLRPQRATAAPRRRRRSRRPQRRARPPAGADRGARGPPSAPRRGRCAARHRRAHRRAGGREPRVKVAFLVNDLQLSGGVGVVVAHARQLHDHHGFDVTLILAREQEDPHWRHEPLQGLPVISLDEARGEHYDVAVSTWWETAFTLFELRADRHASFVQSLEDRFYRQGEVERLGARLVLDLPVSFITEARWIAETLADLRPDAPCLLVRNGIDKDVFRSPASVEPRTSAPLRILVEGYASVWFKGVNEAVAAVGQMHEPHHLTVVSPDRGHLVADGADRVVGPTPQRELAALYAETDVVVKLSRVEGMYGPPLEAFHMGATCVTTEVTGHEEYVQHGVNALLCDWDDPNGTARQLDLLARDRVLLHRLRLGALETARTWPTWAQSGQFMAGALH